MTIRLHRGDLPEDFTAGVAVAIDTETLGLVPGRDRLCVVQLSKGDGTVDVVQIAAGQTRAPVLEALLADPAVTKLFHFARFDIAVLYKSFGVMTAPIYCTKIASKLARTYTDRHGLKDLSRELLGIELSKQQQSSDWGSETLSDAPARLRRVGRVAPSRTTRQARCDAGPRGPRPLRRRRLRLSADARATRSRRLGRDRHIRAYVDCRVSRLA